MDARLPLVRAALIVVAMACAGFVLGAFIAAVVGKRLFDAAIG